MHGVPIEDALRERTFHIPPNADIDGLRLAYLVLPPAVVERVVRARAAHDWFPPCFMQDAVADLISDGVLAAHTRRTRTRYRGARHALAISLGHAAGSALRIAVPTQGLHMLALLPSGVPKDSATRIREVADVETQLLSEMRINRRGPDGFILGFSGHGIKELIAAAQGSGAPRNSTLVPVSKPPGPEFALVCGTLCAYRSRSRDWQLAGGVAGRGQRWTRTESDTSSALRRGECLLTSMLV
jgi:hypothetical protein